MELRHLRYFIAVAEERHITRAAERLGMQQPPLSHQIRALERELNVQLFRRKPRGVEMTNAGRVLLAEARSILGQIDQALATTQRTARGEQGQISIGYTSPVSFHPLVPKVIREFRDGFPLVSVTLVEGYPVDLMERVANDKIDAAFVRMPAINPQGLAIDLLVEETLVVALPAGNALAKRKSDDTPVGLTALANETFIVYVRPDGTRTVISDSITTACRAAGFNPRIGHEVPHVLSTLNLVAAGLGVAVIPASLGRMNIDGVMYRRLRGPALVAPIKLVSRKGETSAVVRLFLKLAKGTARRLRS